MEDDTRIVEINNCGECPYCVRKQFKNGQEAYYCPKLKDKDHPQVDPNRISSRCTLRRKNMEFASCCRGKGEQIFMDVRLKKLHTRKCIEKEIEWLKTQTEFDLDSVHTTTKITFTERIKDLEEELKQNKEN